MKNHARGALGRVATAVAFGTAAIIAVSPEAAAQTNVERRMQELERELATLKKEVKDNADAQKKAATTAPAGTVQSGTKDVELKIYGHVNRAVLFADDGRNSDTLFVDNDYSASRAGFEGRAKISDEFSAGARIEVEIQESPSNVVNLTTEDDLGSQGGFAVRKVEFFIQHKDLGKITVGQSSEAHDGLAEIDHSGTDVFMGSLVDTFGGGIVFINKATNAATGPTMASVFSNFDGSREDLVRYDTPSIFGFVATVAAESDDRAGAALTWAGQIDGTKIAAGVGYQRVPDSAGTAVAVPRNDLIGSASVIHSSGISLTAAAGRRSMEETEGRDDPRYYYGKIGYLFKAFSFGTTAVSVDYYKGEHQAVNDDDSTAWGFGIVQKIDRAAMELYAGVRFYDYERPGIEFETIAAAMTGGRVKF
jgi:predicted porin